MIETRTFKTTDLSSALANVTEAHDKETDVRTETPPLPLVSKVGLNQKV
jgi:hypothetical protein